ncbi:MAG: LysM peptidoglycan-binding domain-containing protein [Elainella sp. Prado103]|nr:LysM peptidoglycan-binding domain-containing protein [Elainella sp. Prado103]
MSAQTFAKLTIHNQDTNHSIKVLFNPDEYTVNKSNTFAQAAVPGNRAPILQYVHGDLQTLEMELLVDTHEKHENQNRAGDDVRKITTQITDLMNKNPKTHAPPVLLLTWGDSAMGSKSWGNQESFTCVLAKVSQRFVMFLPNGTPVRAKLQVTFHEYADPTLAAKDEKTETADFSALYVVHQGETLSSIANKVYENPTFWRVIALRNQIENPKVLPVGTRLLIPQLPFRDPDSGEVIQ